MMIKYDEIRIDELEIFAHHGVYDFETKNGQNFYINAVLYTDTSKAGKTDELTNSTNYGEVCAFITEFLTKNTYKLLEAAAEHVVEAALLQFPLVKGISLEIRKPQAPIPLPFGSVSVKIGVNIIRLGAENQCPVQFISQIMILTMCSVVSLAKTNVRIRFR